MPLSRRNIPDRLFWLHTDKGEFSVKTRYQVARQLKKNEDMRGMSSQSGLKSLVWTKLWNLHIPNKIKVFGWRAFHNILPTRENLVQKHVIEDDTYELCTRTKETAIHALWECSVAQGVWAESIRKLQKGIGGQSDVLQLATELLSKLTQEEFEVFLVQAWVLWNRRNSITYGGSIQDPSRLMRRERELLEEFKEVQQRLAVHSTVMRSATWTAPPENCFKLNFDAAIFKDINASSFGVVIHNELGEVMAALAVKGPPIHDSEEVEVLACRKVLEFAVDSGFAELILEGDSVTVMQTLEASRSNMSRLGHLYGDVQCLRSGLRAMYVSCVSRSANSVAHSLARFAKGVEDEIVWLEDSPPPALEALYFDSL